MSTISYLPSTHRQQETDSPRRDSIDTRYLLLPHIVGHCKCRISNCLKVLGNRWILVYMGPIISYSDGPSSEVDSHDPA
jgi:hypothetical protein